MAENYEEKAIEESEEKAPAPENEAPEKDTAGEEKESKAEKKPSDKKEKPPKEKKPFNAKRLKYGSAATALTVAVIAAVVLVNVIIKLVGDRTDLTIDLTSKGVFEISQESIDYINSLNEDVEITTMSDESVFRDTGSIYYKHAYEVMRKYELKSSRIKVRFVDMTSDPTYANKYSEYYKGNISQSSIVVSCGNRVKVVSVNDLFNTELNYQTFSYNIVSSKAEQVLTSAIMYVTDPEPKTAVIIETEPAGTTIEAIQDLLEDDGFDVTLCNPLAERIPMDADVLVINSPLNDFSEDIIMQLYDYMENGGNYGKNLIYLAAYNQKATKNIDAFLAEWGLVVEHAVVGDTDTNNLASTTSFYAIKTYIEENEFSGNIAKADLPVVSYNARPITVMYEHQSNVETVPLLTTAGTSFVFTDEMQQMIQNGEDPDMVFGNFNTVALSRKHTFNSNNEMVRSNLLVFGSSEMLDPGLTGLTYYNNGDYFISILNTMTGKSNGITIVAKDLSAKSFNTDVKKVNICFIIFLIIIPLAVLGTGIGVWLRRRHK